MQNLPTTPALNHDCKVRLFPLPELVFYPKNELPLHVYESRYYEMVGDALDDDMLIATATLCPGHDYEYHSRPPISPEVCIGRIIHCQKTDDGKYNLILHGLCRARVIDEIEPVRSYRQANVRVLQDSENGQPSQEIVDLRVRLAARVNELLPNLGEVFDEQSLNSISLSDLTDVIAFHFDLDLELKIKLLGERDPTSRGRFLLGAL